MKLKKIHIQNWKCFVDKEIEFEDGVTLLRWQNGSGKSSLIEAIIFALFDKRPAGLDFESLRNDIEKNCRIVLYFEHNLADYVIEREFGKSSSYKLYKDGELISRSKADHKLEIEKIIPETVMSALWGYDSLALSPILKTDYFLDLLEQEFAEPLDIRKNLLATRTFYQKQVTGLEKVITNQEITEKDLDIIDNEIKAIEDTLKSKAFVSDSELVRAKQYEANHEKYTKLQADIKTMEDMGIPTLSRDVCIRLYGYKAKTKDEWHQYFINIEKELLAERSKAGETHPLAKYPKATIDSMLAESQREGVCICCGKPSPMMPTINYAKVDTAKITRLEKVLDDRFYDFTELVQSVNYYALKKQLEALHYDPNFDWKRVIDNYNKETNELYATLKAKKAERERLNTDLGKITDLLSFKSKYNEAKEGITIIDEYIGETKDYHSKSIKSLATMYLNRFNPRYSRLDIENGIYKVVVNNADYTAQSTLAVASLSKGEKTLVALSLILAIRDLFFKNIPLVMDEAFSNLDATNVASINSLLRHDASQWILVSHDERMALENY